MTRIARRKLLASTGGLAAILATGRAPALAQGAANVHWLRWTDFVPASDALLKNKIVQECKKATGITLKVETVNANDLQSRITSAIQSGAGADIIMAFSNWPQLYAESVADASDVAEEIGKAQGGYYDVSKNVATVGNQGEELRAADAEVKENERLTGTLRTLLTELEARTGQVIEDQCIKTVEILRDVVAGFSEVECENMRNALVEGHRGRVWRSDSTLLRQSLEEEFVKSFREAEQEIAKLESHVFPKLKLLLARYRPDWQALDQTATGTTAELPPLTALSKAVALDLGEPWWKQWWTRDRNFEGQVAELDGLIRREFYPIVDELVQSARTQLRARQASSLQEANMVFMGLVELLKEQSRARLERMSALITGGEAARTPEMQRNRDARTAELKSQISKMDLLARRLESIEQAWAEKIG